MIVFRADGNAEIGSGHVMRCLSIADAAKERGEECLFISASADMEAVIKSKSYDNIILNTDYRDLESEDILSVLKAFNSPIVFVDSYFTSDQYLRNLKDYCERNEGKLVYIDDIQRFAYPCNMLINYNIHGSEDAYNKLYAGKERPELIIGTNYAPLRKEFLAVKPRDVKSEPDNILVSTGGSDPEHLAIELVKIAKQYNKTFHFVVGAVNTDKRQIAQEAANCQNIKLHENVSNMSELMQLCDVAISAAGSTLYELCATQTPTVTYILAENQIPIAEGFSTRGIMKNCGDIKHYGAKELARNLIMNALEMCENYEERVHYSQKMKTVADGRGAMRIVDAVLKR